MNDASGTNGCKDDCTVTSDSWECFSTTTPPATPVAGTDVWNTYSTAAFTQTCNLKCGNGALDTTGVTPAEVCDEDAAVPALSKGCLADCTAELDASWYCFD